MTSQAAYRADIDGLRAVSILLVVGFHAGIDRLAGGFVGVDVFFVISGYLITGLLVRELERSGRISMREFYARRIRRLLPLSATVLVVTTVIGAWASAPAVRETLVVDARAAALYVANWRYAAQATAYSDTDVTDSLLVHYWSLSIEEQFYVLWPLLIIGGAWLARRRGGDLRRWLGVLLGLLVAVSFGASVILTDSLGPEAYYLTHTRLWEMGVGAGLALVLSRPRAIPSAIRGPLAAAGVVAIVYAAVTLDGASPFPGANALWPVAGATALIVAGTGGTNPVSAVLAGGPFPLIGRLSYAWYLWHWPAIGITLLVAERATDDPPIGWLTAAAVAGSLALAWVSHHLIENPVRRHPVLEQRRSANAVMGIALTAVPVIIGFGVVATFSTGDEAVEVVDEGGRIVLGMSPAEAIDDTVDPIRECHADNALDATEVLVEPCRVGHTGPTAPVATAVLIGDSHARQWLPAFDEFGRTEQWEIYVLTKAACSVIDVTIYSQRFEQPDTGCTTWRAAVFDEIDALGPDVAVFVRSSGYRDKVLADDGTLLPEDDIGPTWAAGAARTVDRLTAAADRVIQIVDTPWPGFDVPSCLSRESDARSCSFDADAGIRDQNLLAYESDALDAPNATRVDMNDAVCPGEPCRVVDTEGTITYRDSHHLTATFSASLGPTLFERITEAMG